MELDVLVGTVVDASVRVDATMTAGGGEQNRSLVGLAIMYFINAQLSFAIGMVMISAQHAMQVKSIRGAITVQKAVQKRVRPNQSSDTFWYASVDMVGDGAAP